MNKKTARKALSILLSLAMLVSLLAGLSLTASAVVLLGTATGYTSASQVVYKTSGGYIANWGARGENATFLTTYAQSYYTGSYSYATLSALSGDSGTGTSFYSSALGTAIHNMLERKQTSTTSYAGTRDLYKYTDCVNSNYSYISSYYSGTQLNGAWDSGSTWNREHTWPNSKGLEDSDEDDIMMLRPTSVSENSDRGNKAYGASSSYYDPNSEASTGLPNLHGDVARLMLQHLMRWGNTSSFYGSGGVMESRAVLLQWMEEDPVDTWEMGRNDSVQSITGVRNVFVDYPELAFKLLGASVPSNYTTPSGGGSSSSYTVNAISNNTSYGTVSVSGTVITASPKTGYTYANPAYTVTSGSATVTQNGNTFIVNASSDCTVRINFTAKTTVTVTFSANGATSTQTGYTGEAMTLTSPTAPTGYSFVGWVTSTVAETQTKPATIYTTTYTPYASTTLYALYSHTDSSGSGSSTAAITFSELGLQNGVQYLDPFDGDVFTVTFSGGDNDGKYYTSGSAIRVYGNGTMTVAAKTGTITNIVITCASGNVIAADTSDVGTLTVSGSTGTWTGDAASVAFTRASGSGHWRIQSVEATVSGGGTNYYTTTIGTACEHTYTSVVTAPTCTAGGYTTYTCSKCGDTYTGDQTAALGHNYTSVVTAATCTAAGYTTYTCSVCGDTYTGNTTAALGHSYGAFSSNNNGTHSKTCSRCSDVVTEDCNYTSVTNGATTTFTCTVCAYTYQTTRPTYTVTYNDRGSTSSVSCIDGDSVNLPATASTVEGYDFAGWVDAAIPTETTTAPPVRTGSYTPTADRTFYACYTRTDSEPTTTPAEIGNTGSSSTHQYGSPYNFYYKYTMNEMLYTASEIGGAGTITELGFYVASTSGEISPEYVNIYLTTTSGSSLSRNTPYYASDLIPVYSGAPTMGSSTGWEMLTLDTPFDYNGTDNLVVVTTQHVKDYDQGTVTYRVTSVSGKMIYRQSDDNANYGDASKVVSSGGYGGYGGYGSSSNGFNSSNSRPAVKLTLTTDTTYYTTNPVAPCTHENKTLTGYVAATCTTDGYSGDYFCDTCGEKVTDGAVIPATGHTEVTDAAVAPTCTETGLTAGSHCSVCNTVLTAQEVVPATGHTEVTDAAVEPTCTETGLTAGSHCSVCNTVLTAQEVVPATGHTRSYVDNGDGTHDEVCSVCGTVLTDDVPHVYANGVCTLCNAEEPLQLVSRAPVLNGKIDMTYTVSVPSGYTNPRMVFSFNGVNTTVTTYTTDGGNLKFTFTGINPQCMGDEITATLYATKNGSEKSLSAGVYSVRQYCVNMLARTGDNAISKDLRTLLSDLLAYGAAAQTYTGHKANANELVTYGVTGTSYSSFSALTGNAASLFGTADGEYYWISAGLTLTDSVAMNFRFYAASTEQLTVSVCVNNSEQTFSEFTAVSGETNVYEVSFTGVSVEEFGADVTASFELDGTQRGKELTYSVNTYVQSKQSDAGNAALAALVQKLYNYGASAAAYVSANNG